MPSLQALLKLDYPQYEIVVVCDGSKDDTLGAIQRSFKLEPTLNTIRQDIAHATVQQSFVCTDHPKMRVLYKSNGGKADALNCGINAASFPYFCAIDADTLLEKDSLQKLARPFQLYPETAIVGGIVRLLNGCTVESGVITQRGAPGSLIESMQIVEYLRAFFLGRLGWSSTQSIMIISGAFGLFKASAIKEVGGYTLGSLGEDMDLVLKVRSLALKEKKPCRIEFVPDAICWTQAPDDYKTLSKQRIRWQRGLLECLIRHKDILFHKEGGVTSFVAFPFFVLAEAVGPLIELVGYLSLLFFWYVGF